MSREGATALLMDVAMTGVLPTYVSVYVCVSIHLITLLMYYLQMDL